MKKFIIPIGLLLFASCYNDKEDQLYPKPGGGSGGGTACDTANMSFATHIQPIMAGCATAGCHDAVTKSFTHDLSSYTGVVASVNTGRFLGAIRHDASYFAMPKGLSKLSDCDIAKVTAWINQGTKQ